MKVIVIGGVACGPKTASRIKRLNPEAEVSIIEKGELISYAGCGLPFYLGGTISHKDELMTTPTGNVRDKPFFKNVKDINVFTSWRCTHINRQDKKIEVVNLKTGNKNEMSYDKLVLATGGEAIFPPIAGIDLQNIYKLTHPDEAENILLELKNKDIQSVVIVGAGLIGLETAEALVAHGLKVTIVEAQQHILPSLYDSDMASFLTKHLKAQRVNLLCMEQVERFEGNNNGKLTRVHTTNNTIDAQIAIIATGTKANVELARNAGLNITGLGTIEVNNYLETTLDNNIYAGGDCIAGIDRITEKNIFAPMGSTANKHGRIIANNICGYKEEFPGVAGTSICRLFNYDAARTGLTEKQALANGYDCISVLTPGTDKPHFLDTAQMIIVKLVIDKSNRRVLGAQIVGPGDVFSRINVIVTGMSFGMTVDQLANLDLAYAPPFAPAMDNIITAANVARNKLDGVADAYSPAEVKEKLLNKEDFILLDIRSEEEYQTMHLPYDNVKLIPLGKLRQRVDELPTDKEIITFCKLGLRGYEAQRILKGLGFNQVKFFDGGLLAWPYEKNEQ